jgi:Na+/H+ antiporter
MLEVVIALALAILVGNIIAHKTRVTPAIVLIFVGLAIGLIPAHELHEVQSIGLPPHVILEIFLPIMLFWEARNTSWREARNRIRGIILTGTVLVIVTAFGVAGILHEFIGVSNWAAALLIGVALAPTDAVAVATLNGKLPKSAITTLKAEALINDGTTLVLLALALQVAAGQELALGHASGMFVFSFLIGILVGLAVGWVANKIRAHIDNPMWFTCFMLTVPFIAFLLAEKIEPFPDMKGSGVVAVVIAAFFLTYYSPDTIKPQNRTYGLPTWAFVTFVMVGVQLPTAVERMGVAINLYGTTWSYGLLIVLVAWIACVVIRYVFVQVSIFVIRLLDRSEKQRTLRTTHRGRVVSTMAGLRGGVSLAVALSIPASVEYRDFVIFVVSGVVLCSMVVQGMLLPAVIRWANLPVDNSEEEEKNEAIRTLIAESFDSIQEIGGRINAPQEVIDRIAEEHMFNMSMYRNLHTLHMHGDDTPENVLKVLEAHEKEKELRLGVLEVQRDILKRLRDEGRIDTNVLHQIQERLDIEVMRVLGPLELE